MEERIGSIHNLRQPIRRHRGQVALRE